MQIISVERSVEMIPDGASLMIGGFMAVGTPERVVDELVRQEKRELTVIANDTATPDRGIGKLVAAKRVRKAIVSHIGLNPETQRQMMAGDMEIELVPQGTLIERIRAGGYGLGGVLPSRPGELPSRPREFHPESLTDPDLILSHHPARATARRLPSSIEYRVPPVAG